MTDDRGEIENLLARYCELFDGGDLEGYAELFSDATMSNQFGTLTGAEGVRDFQKEFGLFYEDGLPHSRHVTTNLHIEIDAQGRTATARSYVTVFQALSDFPLQPILIGQYRDTLKKINGRWRFAVRDFEPYLVGDLSRHARRHPPAGPFVSD
jgi:hypothetical protein